MLKTLEVNKVKKLINEKFLYEMHSVSKVELSYPVDQGLVKNREARMIGGLGSEPHPRSVVPSCRIIPGGSVLLCSPFTTGRGSFRSPLRVSLLTTLTHSRSFVTLVPSVAVR